MPTDAERWRFFADHALTLHTDGGATATWCIGFAPAGQARAREGFNRKPESGHFGALFGPPYKTLFNVSFVPKGVALTVFIPH